MADAFDISGFYDFDTIKPRITGTRSHIFIFIYMKVIDAISLEQNKALSLPTNK